ncbi:hypothetical protein AB0F72_31605 [Actinoplanes sp. NPDC023936]|uniref:hypothetical protein n=1 Tax=Actinoplanes sp. NPDC023936 TaxID=3154910 RepID=UPI00340C73DE
MGTAPVVDRGVVRAGWRSVFSEEASGSTGDQLVVPGWLSVFSPAGRDSTERQPGHAFPRSTPAENSTDGQLDQLVRLVVSALGRGNGPDVRHHRCRPAGNQGGAARQREPLSPSVPASAVNPALCGNPRTPRALQNDANPQRSTVSGDRP